MDGDESKNNLKHELANEKAKAQAAQHMLKRAADELENLVEADCDGEQKIQALHAAKRFRRAATL